MAVVKPQAWGEGADTTFYCDDESHDYRPTPVEIAETEACLGRKATLEAMDGRIAEFAKSVYPKFPAEGPMASVKSLIPTCPTSPTTIARVTSNNYVHGDMARIKPRK